MSTEKKAMKIVKKFEKNRTGREPTDVSKKRKGYDYKSGDRCIEVKGQKSPKSGWVDLHESLIKKIGEFFNNYYIYVVYDIERKPKLKIIDSKCIFKNLIIKSHFVLPSDKVKEVSDTPLR